MPTESGTERSSTEKEARLWNEFQRAHAAGAREALFTHYVPFAKAIAGRLYRRHTRGDIEIKELYQLAYAGLLEAIDRYDPSRGVPFRAYAGHRISGSVRDGAAHMSEVREQISWHAQLRRERTRSLVEDGAVGSESPIERLSEVAGALAIGFMLEGTGLYAQDECERLPMPKSGYESAAWTEMVADLTSELDALDTREQTIVRQHYVNGVSFDIIASVLGVTKGRVSQIHRSALLKLQRRMHGHGHFRLER